MFQVDTRGFQAMVTDLARMGAKPLRPVIDFETGKILERCVQLTPASTVERITRSFTRKFNQYAGGEYGSSLTRDLLPKISIAPKAGRIWFVDRNKSGERTFYIMFGGNRRWSDYRWAQYQNEEADRLADLRTKLPAAKRSRGLARHSWLEIADSLGLSISVPGYVVAAAPSNGQTYINGTSQRTLSASAYFVEIGNNYPALVNRLGGGQILQRAVNGRLRFFQTNMEKGVFDNIKSRCQKYPGIFVS